VAGAPAVPGSGAGLTDKRQRVIADAVGGKAAKAALCKAKTPKTTKGDDTASGTRVARRRCTAS
jgi:hypothetical protein